MQPSKIKHKYFLHPFSNVTNKEEPLGETQGSWYSDQNLLAWMYWWTLCWMIPNLPKRIENTCASSLHESPWPGWGIVLHYFWVHLLEEISIRTRRWNKGRPSAPPHPCTGNLNRGSRWRKSGLVLSSWGGTFSSFDLEHWCCLSQNLRIGLNFTDIFGSSNYRQQMFVCVAFHNCISRFLS